MCPFFGFTQVVPPPVPPPPPPGLPIDGITSLLCIGAMMYGSFIKYKDSSS